MARICRKHIGEEVFPIRAAGSRIIDDRKLNTRTELRSVGHERPIPDLQKPVFQVDDIFGRPVEERGRVGCNIPDNLLSPAAVPLAQTPELPKDGFDSTMNVLLADPVYTVRVNVKRVGVDGKTITGRDDLSKVAGRQATVLP